MTDLRAERKQTQNRVKMASEQRTEPGGKAATGSACYSGKGLKGPDEACFVRSR